MSSAFMYILMGIFILGAVIIFVSVRPRPVDPDYRKNKLAHDLKWLKVGCDEVEKRVEKAKRCACRMQAAIYIGMVKEYLVRAEAAVKGLNHATILQAESELTAHQQLLANARAYLERAENEQCNVPEEGAKGGCRGNAE